jgi:hypothetical protein
MRRSLIAVATGFGLTVVLFLLGGIAGNICHCMTPMTAFFPYGTALSMAGDWETAGLLLISVQFPIYAWLLAAAPARNKRLAVVLALVAVHAAAVVWLLYG